MKKLILILALMMPICNVFGQTENELNDMIIECVTKYVNSSIELAKNNRYYQYPRKEYARLKPEGKIRKIKIDTIYYCIDGLPSYFLHNNIVINGLQPITVYGDCFNSKKAQKDLRKMTNVLDIRYYLKSDEITILIGEGSAKKNKRFIMRGHCCEPNRYIYKYFCKSNSWEFIEEK